MANAVTKDQTEGCVLRLVRFKKHEAGGKRPGFKTHS